MLSDVFRSIKTFSFRQNKEESPARILLAITKYQHYTYSAYGVPDLKCHH